MEKYKYCIALHQLVWNFRHCTMFSSGISALVTFLFSSKISFSSYVQYQFLYVTAEADSSNNVLEFLSFDCFRFH